MQNQHVNKRIPVDFVRFLASDGIELRGWLSLTDGDAAALHIHGARGNGYENNFLDNLRSMYLSKGISFFSIDTRGAGIESFFRRDAKDWLRGGECYEIFDESLHDIQGAIDFLKNLGKTKFILQGHSLGCSKSVNYVLKSKENIEKLVLIAPTDMTAWAESNPEHVDYLNRAEQLMAEGKGEELVDAKCWRFDETPISAQTYPTLCKAGTPVDIYGHGQTTAPLSFIEIPTLIPYGTEDIGIKRIDGSMEKYLERAMKILNPKTKIAVIDGAEHSFRNFETELADVVADFI